MRIEANKYVALDYTLTLESGDVVDRSEQGEPLAFIFGNGTIIDGLERQLEGLEAGASAKLVVEPDVGYGPVRPELVQRLPREHFPDEVAAGMTFEADGDHGSVVLLVKEVDAENVLVDLNHPLAGKRLFFDVRIAEVRDPTAEELAELEEHSCGDGHDCGSCSC